MLGTPTLAIFLEAIASSTGGQPEEKGVKETGSALRSLITIVRLLGRTKVFSKFGEQRKPALQIVSVLLDKSDCVPLLMTVMGVVGGWLLDERAGLTVKERTSLVWKMMSFDRIAEVPATCLFNLGMNLLLEYYNRSWKDKEANLEAEVGAMDLDDGAGGADADAMDLGETDEEATTPKKAEQQDGDMFPKGFLGKPQAQGLLAANTELRDTFFALYSSRFTGDVETTMKKKVEEGEVRRKITGRSEERKTDTVLNCSHFVTNANTVRL